MFELFHLYFSVECLVIDDIAYIMSGKYDIWVCLRVFDG